MSNKYYFFTFIKKYYPCTFPPAPSWTSFSVAHPTSNPTAYVIMHKITHKNNIVNTVNNSAAIIK